MSEITVKKNKFETDMTNGALFPKLISYSVPLIISGILQLAFNAADLIVVGRFAGDNALAAVGSNTPLITLILTLLIGLTTGSNVMVSRFYGGKDASQLQDTISTSILINIYGGVLFGVIGFFISGPLLRLMGTPEEVFPLAVLYLRIYFSGLPIIAIYNSSAAILRAVGDSRRPLVFLAIAGVLNVIMNLVFVICFSMGVVGVALATVTSQIVSGYLTVRCLVVSDTICRLDLRHMRFSKIQFSEMVRIGVPAAVQGSLFSVSNMIIQSTVNSFGAAAMAGNSAASNIEQFVYITMDAICIASVAAISQNMGARKYDRVAQSVRLVIIMQVVICGVLGWGNVFLRYILPTAYTSDPQAIEAAAMRLLVLGSFYILNGMQNMMGGILRAHGFSILPTVIALMGICVLRVIWIYLVFPHFNTIFCLYVSYPVSWIITTAVQMTFYFALKKKAYALNELRYS
ncbi:MAG: MATE family efflux transporter [Oscillospiraceae bacterium]|nr:MATE family efflux transporter [Oscillospiraceae bacterium]